MARIGPGEGYNAPGRMILPEGLSSVNYDAAFLEFNFYRPAPPPAATDLTPSGLT